MDIAHLPTLHAGFPSPAESFFERSLDIADLLIQHKEFTFFIKVEGNSMVGAGIHDTDILVVDRALEAVNNSIVIAVLNGNFTVKRIQFREQEILLISEHPRYPLLKVTRSRYLLYLGRRHLFNSSVGAGLTRGPIVPSRPQPPQR